MAKPDTWAHNSSCFDVCSFAPWLRGLLQFILHSFTELIPHSLQVYRCNRSFKSYNFDYVVSEALHDAIIMWIANQRGFLMYQNLYQARKL